MKRTNLLRRRPSLETLEDRLVPATVSLVQSGSTLTITGTNVVDRIKLFDNGVGTITVVCDPNPVGRSFTGIAQVNVNTKNGNDTLRYELQSAASFLPLTVKANLGGGRDTFNGFLNGGDLFFGANLTFDIRGQQGSDTLTLDAVNTNTDIFQGAELNVLFNGASLPDPTKVDGNDLLTFQYTGFLAGNLRYVATGDDPTGVFNDTIVGEITTTPGSNGNIFAREFGGRGKDNLTLNVIVQQQVSGNQVLQPTVDAQIDGGPGTDRCRKTFNVKAIRCELT